MAKIEASFTRIQRVLNLLQSSESVVNDNLLAVIQSSDRLKCLALDTISASSHLQFIFRTRDPHLISQHWPKAWGQRGPRNACFAALLDGTDEENELRIRNLKSLRVATKALWLTPPFNDLPGGWQDNIDWIIVDSSVCGTTPMAEDDIAQVLHIRSICEKHGLPFYHNVFPGMPSLMEDLSISPHPFQGTLDLSRPSRVSTPRTGGDDVAPIPPSASPAPAAPLADNPPSSEEGGREPITNFRDTGDANLPTDTEHGFEMIVTEVVNATTEIDIGKQEHFRRLDQIARAAANSFVAGGRALREIRDDQLWREGPYGSWEEYCYDVIGKSVNYANRLIKNGSFASEIMDASLAKSFTNELIYPTNETQVRPLTKLKDPEQRVHAWYLSVERAKGRPTEKIVTSVVAELMPETENSSAKPKPLSKAHRRRLLLDNLIKAAEAKTSWKTILTLTHALSELN